jgi:hypothetical protein
MYRKTLKVIRITAVAFCALAGEEAQAALSYTYKPALFMGAGDADIATSRQGVTVAAWSGPVSVAHPSTGIFIQRYAATGSPLGGLIKINPPPPVCTGCSPASLAEPAVAAGPQGQFVVAARKANTAIAVRLYDASGALVKAIEIPNSSCYPTTIDGGTVCVGTPSSSMLDVAMDDGGNFVVAWMDASSGQIYARRFDALGNASTDAFAVTTNSAGGFSPAIAMNAAGHFAIVWQRARGADCVDGQYSKPGRCDDIVLRRYDHQAVPKGGEIVAAGGNGNLDQSPDIAMDNPGNFVVAWQRYRDICQDKPICDDILAKRYDAAGQALGTLSVRADDSNADINPRVAMDGFGKFVVMWQVNDPAPKAVLFKAYDATGLDLTGKALSVSLGMSIHALNNVAPVAGVDDKGLLNVVWGAQTNTGYVAPGSESYGLVYRRLTPSAW